MDGTKVGGDVGNECYVRKVNLVTTDDTGKKYGSEDMLENPLGKKHVPVLKVVIKPYKVSRRHAVPGKVRCASRRSGPSSSLLVSTPRVERGVNGDDDITTRRAPMPLLLLRTNPIMVIEHACRSIPAPTTGAARRTVVSATPGACLHT